MSRSPHPSPASARRLRSRRRAERRFRAAGAAAIALALGALFLLLASVAWRGAPGFVQYQVTLDVHLDPAILDPQGTGDREALLRADYRRLVKRAVRERFPSVEGRRDLRSLTGLVSSGAAFDLREQVLARPALLGSRLALAFPLSGDADMYFKGRVRTEDPASERRLGDQEIAWLDALRSDGRVEGVLNLRFLTRGDSREPELAGIWGAVVGSFLTLAVTLLICVPVGVAAAVYLEEFAHENRWTDLIEVNVNNLAAVPSIVFGLLGLAVFLNLFGMPRSAPVVGGFVLSLMTLPTVVIASRSAIQSVPPSIREAALGIGASPLQVAAHHVLPLALPGILTGTIIGMSRALGETAPLLMIGMVAFIVDVPSGFTAPSTVLPVQIFLWADSAERAFAEKTSAAILVLLAFLVAMNLAAVLLRSRFEGRG